MTNQFIIVDGNGTNHPFNFENNMSLLTVELLRYKDNAKKLIIPGKGMPANVFSDIRKMQSTVFKHLVIDKDMELSWNAGRTVGEAADIRNILNGISESDYEELDTMLKEYASLEKVINDIIDKNKKGNIKVTLTSYFKDITKATNAINGK